MTITPTAPPRKLTDVTITLSPAEFAVLYALLGATTDREPLILQMYDKMSDYARTAVSGDTSASDLLMEYVQLRLVGATRFTPE